MRQGPVLDRWHPYERTLWRRTFRERRSKGTLLTNRRLIVIENMIAFEKGAEIGLV